MVDIGEPRGGGIVYNNEELNEGFGLVSYFILSAKDSSGTDYLITKNIDYSSDITLFQSSGNSTVTYTYFSGTFSNVRTIKGNVFANWCSRGIQGGAGQSYSWQIKFYRYRPSTTTSTQLGSTWTSETIDLTASDVTKTFAANIPITTATKFRQGDQIKIEVILTYDFDSGGVLHWGNDPQNRDSIWAGANTSLEPSVRLSEFTQFIFRIPYKLRTGT